MRRSTTVALLVGTVLFVINQLDVVVSGHATVGTWLKVALTYAVPWCVATYGALGGAREYGGGARDRAS